MVKDRDHQFDFRKTKDDNTDNDIDNYNLWNNPHCLIWKNSRFRSGRGGTTGIIWLIFVDMVTNCIDYDRPIWYHTPIANHL